MHTHLAQKRASTSEADPLPCIASEFAAQIAINVWLGNLTDAAAQVALHAYALACDPGKPAQAQLWTALVREYFECRERLDLCN